MKKIDTSVVSVISGYPGLANGPVLTGLDFIQAEIADTGNALGLALTSNNTVPCILSGCVKTGNLVSAGWIYAGGAEEIFYVPTQIIIGVPATYISVNISNNPTDVSPNQTVMSDGTLQSMHNTRTIILAYSTLPNTGALSDFGNWVQTNVTLLLENVSVINGQITNIQGTVWKGFTANSYFSNSWADTGGAYNLCRVKSENNFGVLSGNMQGGTTGTVCFTLPAGYRPAQRVDFAISTYSDYGAYISILNTGICTIHFDSGATTFSLEGIRFPLD